MTKEIWFDMDGTIANLYAVEGWLDYLKSEDVYPYANAETMMNFSLLARLINRLQAQGWKVGIISWTSKNGSEAYNLAVEVAKRAWLARHLPSVEWDEIKVVRYGTNKRVTCRAVSCSMTKRATARRGAKGLTLLTASLKFSRHWRRADPRL